MLHLYKERRDTERHAVSGVPSSPGAHSIQQHADTEADPFVDGRFLAKARVPDLLQGD